MLHTPDALVKAVKATLKQNQALKKEATDLKQEVEQLEKDRAGSETDICTLCGQRGKNGYVVNTHTNVRQQIVTAFEERDELRKQVDELKREVNMLSETDTVRPLT